MNTLTKLLTLKPREEAGSSTSRKYTFQCDFALFLLLRRHNEYEDYAYLFDFHDDLMVLNSSENPTEIDFYQIKSKDKGNWTIADLVKSGSDSDKQAQKLSIIGKLYYNKVIFPDSTRSLIFVSNAPFSFKGLKSNEDSTKKELIKANELDDAVLNKCLEKINAEHAISDSKDFESLAQFKVTKLSNKESSTHCLGELNRFIYNINPSNKINSQLAYNQIIGEIRRKTNTTVSGKTLTNISDLITLKGITKNQFLEYLSKAGLYKSVEEEWTNIKDQLNVSSLGAIERIKFQTAFREVSMRLINDVAKIPLRKLKDEIHAALLEGETTSQLSVRSNLMEIISFCESKLSPNTYDIYFVKCLIIKVLYEKYQDNGRF